jgi:hypothetical protein
MEWYHYIGFALWFYAGVGFGVNKEKRRALKEKIKKFNNK